LAQGFYFLVDAAFDEIQKGEKVLLDCKLYEYLLLLKEIHLILTKNSFFLTKTVPGDLFVRLFFGFV
jgi:hypothetical protein